MRLLKAFVFIVILLFATRLVSSGAKAAEDKQLPTPMMRTVDPETVKAGDSVTVSGEYLDKSRVAELYLTDGQTDIKVEILEQSAATLKFKVPAKAAPGRYNLMVLLADVEPKLIEEPARLRVE